MSHESQNQVATLEAATSAYTPFIESRLDEEPTALRSRMQEQGYLFFRRIIEPEIILSLRRQVLELCNEAGWLDPSRELMEGIARPGIEPQSEGKPDYLALYRKVLRLPDFHNFPVHANLLRVTSYLLGTEPFIHPRRMGRVTFPNNTRATTPAHQDFFYIRGTTETYSCWVPLGECPMELGGLAVQPGSHKSGFMDHSETIPGAVGGRGLPTDGNTVWHASDFGLGDALFFHSLTVHKALPNLTADQLRLSTDNRYQRPKDEINPDSLEPHFGRY